MTQTTEQRLRQHLTAKAATIVEEALDPTKPARIARRRNVRHSALAGILALSGAAGLVVLQSGSASDTFAAPQTTQTAPPASSAEEQPVGLNWEQAELPEGLIPFRVEAFSEEFILVEDGGGLWVSDPTGGWTPNEALPAQFRVLGVEADDGIVVVWGSDEPPSRLSEPMTVMQSSDGGQSWSVLGSFGEPSSRSDGSPFVSAGEGVFDAAIRNGVVVVATSGGLSVDELGILMDSGLVDGPDDPRAMAFSSSIGESGVQIWLDGDFAGVPDISLSPEEAGFTEVELAAMSGAGSSGLYQSIDGAQLEPLDVSDGLQVGEVLATSQGLVATLRNDQTFSLVRSDDGAAWEELSDDIGTREGLVEVSGAIYARNYESDNVDFSSDGGQTWAEVVSVEVSNVDVTGGPSGLIASQTPQSRDDDVFTAWSPDGLTWSKQNLTELFGQTGIPQFAVASDRVAVIYQQRTDDNGNPGEATLYIAQAER